MSGPRSWSGAAAASSTRPAAARLGRRPGRGPLRLPLRHQAGGGGTARYDAVLEQARVVQQVVAWAGQERGSIGEACRRLRQQGIPSPGGKALWDRKTAWAMLRNPAYRGTARFGKTRSGPHRPQPRKQPGESEHPRRPCSVSRGDGPGIPIAVPALVSEDLFAAVSEQLEENRRRSRLTRRGTRGLLQGLVVCQQCGHALYGKPTGPAQSRGQRRYTYYRCIGTDGCRFGGQKVCSTSRSAPACRTRPPGRTPARC